MSDSRSYYDLHSFESAGKPPHKHLWYIEAYALRASKHAVKFGYRFKGDCGEIRWVPQGIEKPWFEKGSSNITDFARKDLLWEHTCLEAFLGTPDHSAYWEFNFSPAGFWNCYSFSSYREGMAQEPRAKLTHASCRRIANEIEFEFEFSLEDLVGVRRFWDRDENILVGLTSIVETVDSQKHYFALRHDGEKPDFHLRTSFDLKI